MLRINIRWKYVPTRLMGHISISRQKKQLLEKYGWYRNIVGGYAHPHGIDWMGPLEIAMLSPKQLEYKLKNGSEADLPEELL